MLLTNTTHLTGSGGHINTVDLEAPCSYSVLAPKSHGLKFLLCATSTVPVIGCISRVKDCEGTCNCRIIVTNITKY